LAYIGKQEPEGKQRNRGAKRLWTIPPPPGLSPHGLEADPILNEIPGPLGIELWQRFRDAVVWKDVRAEARRQLFHGTTTYLREPAYSLAEDAEIGSSVRALAKLIDHPDAVDARCVVDAIAAIAEWAVGMGYDQTAALYAWLAARMRPRDPALAFAAGRTERRCARYERAEQWFMRAIGLSRRLSDDAAYADAYLGWGLMEEQRGRRASAREKYVRAWRAALRGSFPQLIAAARHNLIALSYPDEPFEVGLGHAAAAYKLYDNSSPERLALLALDAATLLADHSYFTHALRLYDALAPHIARPAVHIALLSNVARAAAAVGDSERFRLAYEQVTCDDAQAGEFGPAALAEVARAAHTLGYEGKAIATANAAVNLARARGAAGAERVALDVIDAVREKRAGDVLMETPPRAVRFVNRFVKRLSQLRA
jgi:tetratricopeptide (TPR) repeat protein